MVAQMKLAVQLLEHDAIYGLPHTLLLFSCTNFTTLADEQKQLLVILNLKVLSFAILSEPFLLEFRELRES